MPAGASVNFGLATNMENFDVRYEMLQPTSALAMALIPPQRAMLALRRSRWSRRWAWSPRFADPGATGRDDGDRCGECRGINGDDPVDRQPIEPCPSWTGEVDG
jgi:hypothetical protein